MQEVSISSAKLEVISSGTVFTVHGEPIEVWVHHIAKQGTRSKLKITFEFAEKMGPMASFNSEEAEVTSDSSEYKFRLFNVDGDKTAVTQQPVTCAKYAGGELYVAFLAFAQPGSKEKGLHYTIYNHDRSSSK